MESCLVFAPKQLAVIAQSYWNEKVFLAKKKHSEMTRDSCSFLFQGPSKDKSHKGGSLRGPESQFEMTTTQMKMNLNTFL